MCVEAQVRYTQRHECRYRRQGDRLWTVLMHISQICNQTWKQNNFNKLILRKEKLTTECKNKKVAIRKKQRGPYYSNYTNITAYASSLSQTQWQGIYKFIGVDANIWNIPDKEPNEADDSQGVGVGVHVELLPQSLGVQGPSLRGDRFKRKPH